MKEAQTPKEIEFGNDSIESYTAAIQADLRKIQTRNWWSWSNTVVIVLLLTSACLLYTSRCV